MPSQRKTLLCHYHYDALDRLLGHAQPDTPERQRFYCKSRLTTEIQGALQHSVFQQGDQLLAQQQHEGDALDTTLLATDQQRSVLHTLKENNQRHPIAYSPYGHRPAESGLTSLLGFNGERPDTVTGHYLLGSYRAFNPVLMRFNSPDNFSPFGAGGLNAYAYCAGEPVLGSDPTGHWNIAGSFWKGLKNLFGRTPRKFRTPTPVVTQRTADLANTPASLNTARKSSSSSSLSAQSAEHINPQTQRSDSFMSDVPMDMFEPKQKKVIENVMTSPQNSLQQNAMTSPRNPSQQYRSREQLEIHLQLAHDARQMRAYLAGDKGALTKPFNLSDHSSYIREKGF